MTHRFNPHRHRPHRAALADLRIALKGEGGPYYQEAIVHVDGCTRCKERIEETIHRKSRDGNRTTYEATVAKTLRIARLLSQ